MSILISFSAIFISTLWRITDLHPDYSGIRPKIKFENDINDFVIKKEKYHENFYNLIGIDSPGLTSSLAIAEYLSKIIKNWNNPTW